MQGGCIRQAVGKILQGRTPAGLTEEEVVHITQAGRDKLILEDSLIRLDASPRMIVGDIHGHLDTLLYIFDTFGYPPDKRYLFLGDYVDRGPDGLECMCLLISYKVLFPDTIHLLRGNHESTITHYYGFYDECARKLNKQAHLHFLCLFDTLPYAALISNSVLCMHGGLSPDLRAIADLERLPRPAPIPDQGLVTDLMWSDPESGLTGWAIGRGGAYTYGENVVERFCRTNSLQLIVRAHQIVDAGYEFFANKKLITVYSTPNHCERENKASVLCVEPSEEAEGGVTLSLRVDNNTHVLRNKTTI